ncbi:hypothetical protein UlMin_015964 [Ulmus minor]
MEDLNSAKSKKFLKNHSTLEDIKVPKKPSLCLSALSIGQTLWLISAPITNASHYIKLNHEQVRSGDVNAIEYFEVGPVILRRKFYPAATKYLQHAIEKWDGDDQDLAQKKKEYKSDPKVFEEVFLFNPNNKVARSMRDSLKDRVMSRGVPVKLKDHIKSKDS